MNIKINYTNKKIQDVTTKDVVVSFDIENDNFRHNPVVETHTPIVEKDRQIKFTCDDGTTFTTSTSHPACYLNSFNKWDYKQSGDVILGDIFKSSKNIETKVVDICVDLNEDPQFYDITVDNDNNYLAGDDIENMAVVHNSSTVYVPFWHKEILDVLVLKNNKGTDDNRVRKLDYNIQFNRLFYKRVVEKGDITLFSPADAPSLYEAFFESNEKFEELYLKMENNKNIKSKKIKAVELFNSLIQERIGTGRIYVMNVDHVNSHSAFLDKVYMSNLCTEITLPTKPIQGIDDTEGEIALCVLAAINLGQLKDLSELEGILENTVRSLDYVIDNQEYPIEAAKKMLKRRSLGIGVTNLAYYLAKNDVKYTDPKALLLIDEVMEHIQYYAIKASVKLAKEFGKCEYFDRTKYSQGILPIDTYNKNVDAIVKRDYTLDWENLRLDVVKYGMRNSTLTAIMPCESSSVVTNSTNGIEPIRSLITTKKSKAGLIRLVAPEMNKLKNKYQLSYDIKDNKDITNVTAVVQKWIDQAISVNHYYDHTTNNEISLQAVGYDLLYAYKMGTKCLYYANTNDGKTDKNDVDMTTTSSTKQETAIMDDGCEGGACSV